MPNAAIILAAGQSSRIQETIPDKTLERLAGRPAIAYSFEAFQQSKCVATIVIVYRDDPQRLLLQSALADSFSLPGRPVKVLWVKGGRERQNSVLHGLHALPAETGLVFIHDAARPFISADALRRLAEKALESGAACLAHRVIDTIKQVRPTPDLALDAFILRTVDRARLWAMETPQVFDHKLILAAYQKIGAAGLLITDDAAALEESGHPVALVENSFPNPKLTTAADLPYLEYLLRTRTEALQ